MSWEDYQRHESIQGEHAEGRGAGFTFRHVGEGFVPDRQQRQQVEEERHEGSHQQTAPAETTTAVMSRSRATSKLATELRDTSFSEMLEYYHFKHVQTIFIQIKRF